MKKEIIPEKAKTENKNVKGGNVKFKVQFITSSIKKNPNSPEFKGLENIDNYIENGIYKYTIGNEIELNEAKKLLSSIKEKGFKDAFIIAFSDGVRLKNINEALKIQETIKIKQKSN